MRHRFECSIPFHRLGSIATTPFANPALETIERVFIQIGNFLLPAMFNRVTFDIDDLVKIIVIYIEKITEPLFFFSPLRPFFQTLPVGNTKQRIPLDKLFYHKLDTPSANQLVVAAKISHGLLMPRNRFFSANPFTFIIQVVPIPSTL